MKHYALYNVNIITSFDLTEQMLLLREELGSNKGLKECQNYSIFIFPYHEYSQDLLKKCIRVYYHPLSKKEIWQDPDTKKSIEKTSEEILIRYNNTYTIYINNEHNIYSYLRSKVCEIIRECMLTSYPFGLHAALIGKDKELSLIIGAKGSGKTSSVLYAFRNGWDIYTDELVFIDRERIEVLERYPGIAPDVENNYFADRNFKSHAIIKGYLTRETKKIINIDIRKCKDLSLSNIKSVYVLTNYKNNNMLEDYKKIVFYNNFIIGSNMTNHQYNITQDLIYKSKMININEFANRIQEEHL